MLPTAYALSWLLRGCNCTHAAGEDGSYGTSIERYKALDPASDITLAFKQNGRLLTPDHGYPLRIIIPGEAVLLTAHYLSYNCRESF